MSRTILVNLMVAAVALVPASLAAQPVDGLGQPTARVSFADLNLSTRAGQASLDRRIERAIESMCGQEPSANLELAAPVWKCRAAAQASARRQRELAVASAQQRSIEIASRDR